MAEFTTEVAAANTERRQWWLEKEDIIKECLLGEMELVENEEEEAKSGGAAAVAIEFGDRERLRGVCLIRKFVSNCVQLL